MPVTPVPCRAKDTATCPYHGPAARAEDALNRGDLDTWLRETENMTRNANLPEVIDFAAERAAEVARLTTPDLTYARAKLANRTGLDLANATHQARFTTTVQQLHAGYLSRNHVPGFTPATYSVGGTPSDITGEPTNTYRTAYQQIANDILDLSDTAEPHTRHHGPNYRANRTHLIARILEHQDNARKDHNHALATAYGHAYKLAYGLPYDGTNTIPTGAALRELDRAYWQDAAMQPVPQAEAPDAFDERFTTAYMIGRTKPYRLRGVNEHTHKLTGYQAGLVDTIANINQRTREVDTADGTHVLTDINKLSTTLASAATIKPDTEAARAYRDVAQLLNYARPVAGKENQVDAYDLHKSIEELFGHTL